MQSLFFCLKETAQCYNDYRSIKENIMEPITIYSAYMRAKADVHEMKRNACLVTLVCESARGHVRYLERVNFIPFEDEEDFRDTYDAQGEKVLFEGKGRRSKAKDKAAYETLETVGDELARQFGGVIHWDQFITEPRKA